MIKGGAVLIMFIHFYPKSVFPACPVGFFGSPDCNYKCHCHGNQVCTENGECPRCDMKYYGLGCQYINIPLDQSHAHTDRNHSTCAPVPSIMMRHVIDFNTRILTFRYIGLNLKQLLMIAFVVKTEIDEYKSVVCNIIDNIMIDNSTLDIYCGLSNVTAATYMSSVSQSLLCEFYVSGGRLLSPEVNSFQISSTASGSMSWLNDTVMVGPNCVKTKSELVIVIVISFDVPHDVNYVRFHADKRDHTQLWANVSIEGIMPNGTKSVLSTYTLKKVHKTRFHSLGGIYPTLNLTMTFRNPKSPQAMSICELEVYGDCVLGYWGLGCLNKCSPYCNKTICSTMYGYCNCSHAKYYGRLCENACSPGCGGTGLCHYSNAHCLQDCLDGYYGPTCARCHEHCLEQNCDKKTGICKVGCVTGFYGNNCSIACPYHCVDNICDRYSRKCIRGCHKKYTGKFCEKSCKNCAGDGTCSQKSQACAVGCMEGFSGDTCTSEKQNIVGMALGIGALFTALFVGILVLSYCFKMNPVIGEDEGVE